MKGFFLQLVALVVLSGCHVYIDTTSAITLEDATIPETGIITEDQVLWLDASDLTTFTMDGMNRVSAWSDKSGNLNHANQVTLAARPILVNGAINSLPAVVFDGTDDFLRVADHATLKPSEMTVFVVAQYTNYTTETATLINKSSNYITWNDGYGLNVIEQSAQNEFQFWVNDYIPGATQNQAQTTYGDYHIWNGSYGSDLSSFWIDKILMGTDNSFTGAIVHSNRALTIGASYLGTTEVSLDDHLDGEIAEIIIYNRALTEAERLRVEAYLADKWGL